MATLTVQEVPVSGLAAVQFAPADAGGDDAASADGVALLVRNDDTASVDVTVATPGTVRGLAVEDPQITVPADGGLGVFPLVRSVFGASAQFTYSDVTSLSVAVIRLER